MIFQISLSSHKLLLTATIQAMHVGVIRDLEQQKIKRERLIDFEMQKQLEEEYRKVQTVSDSTNGEAKAK